MNSVRTGDGVYNFDGEMIELNSRLQYVSNNS
jgi:hypothetical protein